jgi:hypothetical protein
MFNINPAVLTILRRKQVEARTGLSAQPFTHVSLREYSPAPTIRGSQKNSCCNI